MGFAPVTGREAIHAVHHMTPDQRTIARQSSDATLARVATWPETDPEAWKALLRDLRLVWLEDPPMTRVHATRLEPLWRQRAWSDEDLAALVGTTVKSIRTHRCRRFQGRAWTNGKDAQGRRTWQLVDGRA